MKKWTIMVYMAGDNDLSEDMTRKLVELQDFFQSGSTLKNIGLLVYFDGGNPLKGTQVFNFTKDFDPKPIKFPNAADPKSVEKFVKWCVKDQKVVAENYVLLFSGHGDGFQRTAFMRDMTSFDFMTVIQLKKKLADINQKILNQKKLPLLAFDSCVMSMVEVVKEFTEVAEVFIGSEGYMPTTGLSYTRFVEGLQKLDLQSQISVRDISNLIVQAAQDNNENYAALQLRSLDMSIVTLESKRFDSAVKSIDDLGTALLKALNYSKKQTDRDILIIDALEKVILTAHWKCQTFLFDQAIDVLDFCRILKQECFKSMLEKKVILEAMGLDFVKIGTTEDQSEIQSIEISASITAQDEKKHATVLSLLRKLEDICKACNKVTASVEVCINRSCCSGPEYQFSTGIAVYFPWSMNTFEMTRAKFGEYSFACRNGNKDKLNPWYKFLEAYLRRTIRAETLYRLDPPPRGMLASESQYKEYFMRIKNFSLNTPQISSDSRRNDW